MKLGEPMYKQQPKAMPPRTLRRMTSSTRSFTEVDDDKNNKKSA